MDDLQLAVTAERLGVCGQARGVPAVVTGELTCMRRLLRDASAQLQGLLTWHASSAAHSGRPSACVYAAC